MKYDTSRTEQLGAAPRRDPGALRALVRLMRAGKVRGPYRFADSVARVIPVPQGPVTTSIDGGLELRVEPASEPIDLAIYQYGSYEPGTLAMMRALIRQGDGVLDVGANIGQMTCYASRLVGSTGQVIAMEPVHRTFEILSSNVLLNSLENVRLVRRAAGATSGQAGIRFRPALGSGASTIVEASEPDEVVDLVSVDEMLRDFQRVPIRFVKIDVEGYELEALKGATSLLENDHPIVCMEYSLTQDNTADAATDLLIEHLDGVPFRTRRPKQLADPGGLVRLGSRAEFPTHDNIYVVPRYRLGDIAGFLTD